MSTTFEKGYALLIGVSKQENTDQATPLPETEKDVTKLAQILLDPKKAGYKQDNVKILLGENATRLNILKKLIWLKKALKKDPTGTAIIYFSGHGYQREDEDKYFLIPYDFDIDLAEDTAIEDRFFAKKIGDINAQRMLLLLDCCHAAETDALIPEGFSQRAVGLDSFISGGKGVVEDEKQEDNDPGSKPIIDGQRAGDGAKDIVEDEKQEDNDPGSKPIIDGQRADDGEKDVVEDEKQEDNDPGSKPTGETTGSASGGEGVTRAVLVSSRGSELSWIHKTAGMSIFTYHLIEALNGHGKARGEDGTVNVLDVMSHVVDSVPETAREQRDTSQTPNARYHGENFPIALLQGGEGMPANEAPPKVEQVMQTIINRTVNVDGDGNVVAEIINVGGDFNM